MIQSNPNAAVAGGVTGLGVLAVYVAGLFGLDVPAEVAVAAVGSVAAGALFIGRVGLKGLADRLWRGSSSE